MPNSVLIVDDNKAINLNLQCFFEDHNIPTICCFSGEEALQHIKNNTDCTRAIVNLRLPGMSGDALIIALKKLNPDLHILIHTGSRDFTVGEILLSIGIEPEDLFYKPQANMEVFIERFNSKSNQKKSSQLFL